MTKQRVIAAAARSTRGTTATRAKTGTTVKVAASPVRKVKAAPSSKAAAPKKTALSRKASPSASHQPPAPDLYSSIHALLHTMRLIEQHEEPLCSMHDEIKRTGKLSAAHRRKLQQLVTELPARDYQADLEAVQQALSA